MKVKTYLEIAIQVTDQPSKKTYTEKILETYFGFAGYDPAQKVACLLVSNS